MCYVVVEKVDSAVPGAPDLVETGAAEENLTLHSAGPVPPCQIEMMES